MHRDLTHGPIGRSIVLFALPMITGNLLQQLYNIADTLIVGRVLGSGALAAVGSAYTLMTFLTSIFLGLSHGRWGAVFHLPGAGRCAAATAEGLLHGAVLDFRGNAGGESAGVFGIGRNSVVPAGAGGCFVGDAGVSTGDFWRDFGHVYL